MPKQVQIAAAAAVNVANAPQVVNALILSAKLGTKKVWEKVPHADGTFELRESSAPTINLRLDGDYIKTSSGYRMNVLNMELETFNNRLGSAKQKETRHLEHKLLEDISVLEDLPITLTIFTDISDDGQEIERYKIAF